MCVASNASQTQHKFLLFVFVVPTCMLFFGEYAKSKECTSSFVELIVDLKKMKLENC